MKSIKRFLCLVLSATLTLSPLAAYPAYDPVNDDTDLFLANPNITSQRPNVLLVLDNTANWNTPFTNEKNALVQVVNGLDDGLFNVGLMMMVETGSPNDNTDGGYVRFAVRQMTGAAKTNLASLVQNFDILNDKGNNNTVGYALHEAYLYYAGLSSRASGGKFKTDHDATNDTLLAGLSGNHALPGTSGPPAMPVLNSVYRSPIVDGCQKNFIIYISNGQANENAAARAEVEGFLATLTGQSPPAVIGYEPGVPTGQQANWGDEMAKYLANADVSAAHAGTQNVYTYTVEVNPQTSGLGPDMTALMKSVASNGKGSYFGVTSDASGTQIVDALNAIFSEIQAKESVFAATTLPVSANVQGTHVNQVYVGVFRPDGNKAPRWLGNLKMYNFAQDGSGNVFLADAANGIPPAVGNPAVDEVNTGFIRSTAKSFWTQTSTFWGFRDASLNGAGGSSDSPDGQVVEKGGAAQQVRIAAVGATAGGTGTGDPAYITANRKFYTYTNSGFAAACTTNCSLSVTPFANGNTDITNTALALDTRFVSPLTAFATKDVTSLNDRKSATLTNALNPISVSSLSNGATTRSITNLTTAVPKTVTALTGLTASSPQVVSLSQVVKVTGNTYQATAATTTLPAGYVVGATVTISGVSGNSTNGTRTISAIGGNTFDFSCAGCGNGTGTGGSASVTAASDSTTATATLAGHGYTNGQSVTISGASPTQFNGTFNITVIDANSFSYIMSVAGGAAAGTILAAGNTTTATATTSAAHGFSNGSSVTISGASLAGYNGTFTVSNVTSNTFQYTVNPAVAIGPNTASPVYATQGGSTTVTVTTAVNHGFVSSPPGTPTVTVANSNIGGYNGTFEITVTALNQFTYVPSATVLPANTSATVTASTGFSPTVTATVTSHGFVAGDTVIIEGGTQTLHTSAGAGSPSGFTVLASPAPTANTFAYTNNQTVAPAGSYTARPSSGKVTATVTAHGYSNGDQITISGASPSAYNGIYPITVVDANTFTYTPAAAPGANNTSTAVTASKKTTTARATSISHGFSDGTQVTIANASPAAFNGVNVTISVPFLADGVTRDPNTFTYTISSAEGDATGPVTATQTGATSADRTRLINWVRGEDNFQDENTNASTTDIRASAHGDVLHSRPAVVNYSRTTGSDNDVFLFYGSNDGVFRAVKGGYALDAASTLLPGQEAWGFIPEEFFGQFNRMRKNSPIISSTFKKPYFMDGPIGIYTKDTDGNKRLGDATDKVNLYMAQRRGGRFIYALDVNNPVDPKFLWKIDSSTTGFSELGQTWSQPTVVDGFIGQTDPVLVFGGGYDPAVEDIDPTTIPAGASNYTNTSVTTAAGATDRTMGRAIYVVNALTGALLWSVGGANSVGTFSLTATGMDFAIPSDVTVVKNESGGDINRAYVGDTGGNVWRIDFKDPIADTTVTKIASVADYSTQAGRRKFQHAPDVVGGSGFDAVLIGSGDREHPLDAPSGAYTGVVNNFYMFKDKGTDAGPVTGTTFNPDGTTTTPATDPVIVESALFDATLNCIQDVGATGCAALGQGTTAAAQALLNSANGWFLSLVSVDASGNKVPRGEKVVGNAITIGGTVFFGTNQPASTTTPTPGVCESNLGTARLYGISATDATSVVDVNSSGSLTGADRFTQLAGGGFPPPATHVVVTPEGGDTPKELVCLGIHCVTPTVPSLNSRVRKYWYKEVDQ
jgi:Tfp pilus tip-associated adhesin PilY1